MRNAMKIKSKFQKGFTLLEYCAGAAVLMIIVYIAMRNFGFSLQTFLNALGTWAVDRGNDINNLP